MDKNRFIKILLICFINLILISREVLADTYIKEMFDKISIDHGLSNEYITEIFQDSKGYMWIGTKDGLNRFDGKNIKTYNSSTNEVKRLSSSNITALAEDLQGNIWIGTDNGLDILLNNSNEIIRLKDQKLDGIKLGSIRITDLLESKSEDSIIWVGTEKGLLKVDTERKETKSVYTYKSEKKKLSNSYITYLYEREDESLWVGTANGITIIDKDGNIYHDYDGLYINSIEEDASGYMWISTKEGIMIYDLKNNEKKEACIIDDEGIKLANDLKELYKDKVESNIRINNSKYILAAKNGEVWISSSEGVYRYSSADNNMYNLKKEISNEYSLSSNYVTAIYEDRNGTIWIGTEKGINILNINKQFTWMGNVNSDAVDVLNYNITSIIQHNEEIWISTKYDGIFIFQAESGNLLEKLHVKDEIKVDSGYIKDLFTVNNRYVIAVTDKELIIFDRVENISFTKKIKSDPSFELRYLYSDEEYIWVASSSDFETYNIETGEIKSCNEEFINFNINPGAIRYILQDKDDDNILYLGGVDTGVIKYHKRKGIIQIYNSDLYDEDVLVSNYINCMTFDNEGDLWVGTNLGLCKLNLETGEKKSYTITKGLTNNFINSILIDDNNDIWISTNKGLNRINEEDGSIANFTNLDGIIGYQFCLNSSLKTEDGVMIFGSTNGITYFNPKDIINLKKVNLDKVVIGDIYVGKNRVVYDGNELVLEYSDRDLSVEMFLPVYENLNNIKYEYLIEKTDEEWVYLDCNANMYFKNLEPGKYTLRIRARDGHGNLSEEAVMNIKVKNTFLKTPIAYLIYVLIIIAVVYYVLNYFKILKRLVDQKTETLNKQFEENKRLSEEIINKEKFKNTYFVNLSHELRTPINVISSTVQLINMVNNNNKGLTQEQSNKYMNIIDKNCCNLLKIISDIIDSSKIETGHYKINKSNNDIIYTVEEAALSMSKYIEEKGISLIIDPYEEEKIISFDSTEIERCIINLLGNAVKFTPSGGEIRVNINKVGDIIEIIVEDTGIGISKEDQLFIFNRFSQVEGTGVTKASSSGIGLTLVKQMVDLHGGYVKLESEINKGSKFTIGLPDKKEIN